MVKKMRTGSSVLVWVLAVAILSVFVISVSTDRASLTEGANASQTVVMLSFNISNTTHVVAGSATQKMVHWITVTNPLASADAANAFNFTNVTVTNGTWWAFNSSFVFSAISDGVNITIKQPINSTGDTGTGQNWTIRFVTNASVTDGYVFKANVSKVYGGTNLSALAGIIALSSNVTLDNTAPKVNITMPSGWKRQNITFFANATDATANITNGSMFFFIGNATANYSFSMAKNGCTFISKAVGYNCTRAINVSNALLDGNYTVWVNVSDRGKNAKYKNLSIGLDNTPPPTISLSLSSAAGTELEMSYGCEDTAGASGLSTCVLSSSSGTVSGSKISGLTCGTAYTITVTATDGAGNSGTTSGSHSTLSCGNTGGTTSGGSSTTTTWTTHAVDDVTFEAGYTSELAASNRLQVNVGTEQHHVGVVSVATDTVTIEIASDPVTVTLAPGEDTKVDVLGDGFYDIYVLLEGIINGRASLKVQKIHEEIPEGEGAVTSTGQIDDDGTGDDGEEDGERNLTWLWWTLGILVVLILVGVGANKARK